jgi:hypothetical protein
VNTATARSIFERYCARIATPSRALFVYGRAIAPVTAASPSIAIAPAALAPADGRAGDPRAARNARTNDDTIAANSAAKASATMPTKTRDAPESSALESSH